MYEVCMEVKIRGLRNATIAALNRAAEEQGISRNEYLKEKIEGMVEFPLLKEQEDKYINLLERQEKRYVNLVEKMLMITKIQNQKLEQIINILEKEKENEKRE